MSTPHSPEYWRGRRVLVTGHTGFKGSWLATYLTELGATVMGVSLPGAAYQPDLWTSLELDGLLDVRDDVGGQSWLEPALDFSPEVLIHLAAQALVSIGYAQPELTFRSNTVGTINVMTLLGRLSDLQAALIVTTDKVYDTRQTPPYAEAALLGGDDPYAASKAAAELVVQAWPAAEVGWATARAGNVIGGGDWSRGRILPDLVRAWSRGEDVVLRRPTAIRPWQHVIEPLVGYLVYCERIALGDEMPTALNFGPSEADAVRVDELVSYCAEMWKRADPNSAPRWRIEPRPDMLETETLTLDASASRLHLGLENRWGWRDAVDHTLSWYRRHADGAHPRDLMLEQFRTYFT